MHFFGRSPPPGRCWWESMANSKVSNRVSLARASTKAATSTASNSTPAIVHAVPPSILLLVGTTACNWTGAFDSASGIELILSSCSCAGLGVDCSDFGIGCADLRTSNAGSKV